MGFRFRKSINLGGGFRVNFSKSGVGYSWGAKGYRVTKKAGGGVRRTYSIPGTGISWTEDSKKRKKSNNSNNYRNVPDNSTSNEYNTAPQNVLYQAADANINELVTDSSKDFLDAIRKFATIRGLLKWSSIISFFLMFGTPPIAVLFVLFLVGFIAFTQTSKIAVEYNFDEYGTRRIQMLNNAMANLMNSNKTWQIITKAATTSRKMNAGATSSVNRKQVRFLKKTPFFLKTDATCYYIKLSNCQVFVLPDRLVVKGKKGWGVVEYSQLQVSVENQIFIESEAVPYDATVVGHTWQYVNKSGGPDKRFKNNRQLPECKYGQLSFKSDTGLNIILQLSNYNNAQYFKDIVEQMISEAEHMKLQTSQERQRIEEYPEMELINETINQSQQDNLENKHKEALPKRSTCSFKKCSGFEDFILRDASAGEEHILRKYWDGIINNGLSTSVSCCRKEDGSIEVLYKGNQVGKFYINGGESWIFFYMGTSDKSKQINGSEDEIAQHVTKWLRYIINYL